MSFATKDVVDYEFAKKKYGNTGRPTPIYANFFPIKINCRTVYHYNIDIQVHDFIKERDDKNVPQRNRLLQQKKMLRDCNFAVFDRFYKQETSLFTSEPIFDGRNNMYSKTKLNINDTVNFQVKQKVPERKFPATFDITITIPKESHELDLSVLNNKGIRSAEKEIQALDIIFQYGPKRTKLAVGSNFFLRSADLITMSLQEQKKIRFDLGEMKEASFGHYQSAKLTETGMQLNVDRVALVLNKGGKIINIIEQLCTEMRSKSKGRDAPPPRQITVDRNFKLNGNERSILNNELKNLNFIVDHIAYQPKNKIFCLTDLSVSEIFFDQKSRDSDVTTKVSVKDYFEKVYHDYLDKQGKSGLFPNLPCVQVGKMNVKYFPLEVVSILQDQYSMKPLKSTAQSTMTKTCGQQKPTERFQESELQVRTLIKAKDGETDYLKHFNIEMQTKYTQANGRVLDGVNLEFSNKSLRPQEGQWKTEPFVLPSKDVQKDWMVVNITEEYGRRITYAPKRNQIDEFVDALLGACKRHGVNLQKPCEIVYDEIYKNRLDLEDAIADYLHDHKSLKLIIFVIPKNDELYSNIKFISEIQFGIMTQCVSQDKNRQFGQVTYVSNLLLKINAKLGGINTYLSKDSKVGFLKKKTMIMGIDVTHPSRNDRLGNSIASVVATYDNKMVNYYSKSVVQPKPRSEVVLLDEITVEMINNFKNKNNFLPDYFLIYRDGVSDGQFNEVIEKEINLMKKAFSDVQQNYHPKITYIIVQKRHHTRFLPVNERDRIQRSQNVLPGTVVDNTIVSNFFFEFYLCAHYGALGTSRPTRYIVLHDDSEFSGDEIQKTTNLLSYLFPRCCKAVSVPSPVLYAHLAAKRARSYLYILDNNKGDVYGELELTPSEVRDLNEKIQVKENLRNILYYV